jgi:hypothetical protein
VDKIKLFQLRLTEDFLNNLAKALETSVLKSKHAYIIKAIEEKIEREAE